MTSNWSIKIPSIFLKKIRGSSKETQCLPPPPPKPPLPEDRLTKDCREFYERRCTLYKVGEDSSGPSSLCSSGYFSLPYGGELEEEDPLQSKMQHLRKEFLSLVDVDNQLFKQLLTLNDAIRDFKELHRLGEEEVEEGGEASPAHSKIFRSKSFLEDTKTFQRARISFPATRRNRRKCDEEPEDPDRMFHTLPSSANKKKLAKDHRSSEEWRVASSRSSASSSSSSSSSTYERRSWKRYNEQNESLDSGIHAASDSSGENSDNYST